MKQFALGVVVSIVIFALVVAAYFFGKNSDNTMKPTPTPAVVGEVLQTPEAMAETPAPTTAPTPDPAATIAAAISAKDYASLQGMMVESVVVRIESSGCCQPQDPTGAVAQLKYLDSATGSWVFSPTDPIVLQLADKSPDYWGPENVVGITSDKYAVSFEVDAGGKIKTISMAANYGLILNQ